MDVSRRGDRGTCVSMDGIWETRLVLTATNRNVIVTKFGGQSSVTPPGAPEQPAYRVRPSWRHQRTGGNVPRRPTTPPAPRLPPPPGSFRSGTTTVRVGSTNREPAPPDRRAPAA